MAALFGIAVVVLAITGGYLMEGGHLAVLNQPAEFVIIFGAAIGAMLIGTPFQVIRDLVRQLGRIAGGRPGRAEAQELLVMLYELLATARGRGLLALEPHVEKPGSSPILKKYPRFLADRSARDFLFDTLRIVISGAPVTAHDLDELMELDMETQEDEKGWPARVLQVTGDSLPGLGIVAAVLGIVITMQALDGPPEEIGHKVGAALVGTFLGVLMAYGFVQPLAANLKARLEADLQNLQVIRATLTASQKGQLPSVAVEFGRRSFSSDVRPRFVDLERACRAARSGKLDDME